MSLLPFAAAPGKNYLFGISSDGNVTISSGAVVLGRDMQYANLTINGTGRLITNGWRVFVSGTLDISSASSGAINYDGNNGVNASGATGGSSIASGRGVQTSGNNGTLPSSYFVFNTTGAGGNGSTTNGSAGTTAVATNTIVIIGGQSANAGSGGNSGGNTGGAAGARPTNGSGYGTQYQMTSPSQVFLTYQGNQGSSPSNLTPGQYGPGGGGGAGDGTNSGGGGGGSAQPGGIIWISAFNIQRGTNSNTSIISAKAGVSGNGASAVGGNAAGGGGSGGSGGGWILIIVNSLSGSVITNCIDVSGTAGGNGGNGLGTGLGGVAGTGGNSGNVQITVLSSASYSSSTFNGAGSNPTAPSGATGGIGGAGAVLRVNL